MGVSFCTIGGLEFVFSRGGGGGACMILIIRMRQERIYLILLWPTVYVSVPLPFKST